ncbi:MAG: hypothetical protein PVG12_09170 [Gammaproteobacteria bacterium]|jgi:hypothetical protein
MFILGQDKEEIHVDTAEANRNTVISLAEQARFGLNLFTQDLDPNVYDNADFEQCIFNLARKHHSARIRILTQDSARAERQGHSLIRLAQKLTSSVFIHNTATEHKGEASTFMVVDGTGYIYRPRSTSRNYDAVCSFMAPQRAAELDDLFNEMWERSAADTQIRRLYI